jgi:integrase
MPGFALRDSAAHRLATRHAQGQMGHATLAMTADRYGHFGEVARKREAAKLEGAFNV